MVSQKEFDCIDVFGNKVRCSKKRWGHISDHPEMIGLQSLIKSIIGRPDFVNRSRLYANRFLFYGKCFLAQLGGNERYVRIVVEYNLGKRQQLRGVVITSMACDSQQLGEVLIWKGQAI